VITSPAVTEPGIALLATVRQVNQVWGLCAEVMAIQAREATAFGRLMAAAWTAPIPQSVIVAAGPVESVQPVDERNPVAAEVDTDDDGVLLEVLIKRLLEADLLVSR
jgi:hypothetical protein